MAHAVVLFDGVCNLCNWAVKFIIRRDPQGFFQFASLQSPVGRRVLAEHRIDSVRTDSIILIAGGRAYTHSTAALHIARHLSGLWSLLWIGMIVPRPVRDLVYRIIAHNRYRWFGREDVCMVPTPALRDRFL